VAQDKLSNGAEARRRAVELVRRAESMPPYNGRAVTWCLKQYA